MAIQFFCAACSQPIEVDDEFANQPVTCPYCRKVVTTPSVSDPAIAQKKAEARSSGLPPTEPYASVPPISGFEPQRNTLGWVALGCATGVLIVMAISCGSLLSIMRAQPAGMTQEQMQKNIMEEMTARHGLTAVMSFGFLLLPIVGIPAAVYSLVKRASPRWPGIAALAVLGPVFLCMCLGFFLQFSMLASQGAGGG